MQRVRVRNLSAGPFSSGSWSTNKKRSEKITNSVHCLCLPVWSVCAGCEGEVGYGEREGELEWE